MRQVAEGLELSGEQRQSITGLWRGFNERCERILAVRQSIHDTITSSMPDGIMGRDFARNFLKARTRSAPSALPWLGFLSLTMDAET